MAALAAVSGLATRDNALRRRRYPPSVKGLPQSGWSQSSGKGQIFEAEFFEYAGILTGQQRRE